MSKGFDKEKWMKEVKDDLTLDRKAYEKSPCIFSASTALFKEYKDAYVPQIVSIGPCHFNSKDQLSGMETFKGDAARRQVVRIQSATGNYQFNFEYVITKITNREEKIKQCYDKGTPFNGEVLHWMVARDACFILEFFRNHCSGLEDDESFKNDFSFLPKLHPIFGPESENPGVKSEIMKDLIKLDNQIPLFVLEDVLGMEMRDSPDNGEAKAKLDKLLKTVFEKIYYRPFEFCAKGEPPKRSHILDMYHYSCLGVVAAENENELENDRPKRACFGRALQPCQELPNHIERERPKPSQTLVEESSRGQKEGKLNVQGSSSGETEDFPIEGSSKNVKVSKESEWGLKIPSAVQLKNGGVIFQANGKNVDDIKFEGKTLTLVPLKLDVDSEVYIRNLMALEICSPDYKHKRMTAYAKFMYELCQTEKGVDVMRTKGVIIGNLWHSRRVTRLLSVSNLTISQPACKSIKETRENLSRCYKTRRSILLKILWNEFWNAYGSKPWLVVGGFGATIVLCLTAIQVFCLFKHCGPRSI